MKTCNDKNPCIKCIFVYDSPTDGFLSEYRCRRLQSEKCDNVLGTIYYVGKSLSCDSEREVSLTFKERIFGPNKDKCGKEGKYFVKKEE